MVSSLLTKEAPCRPIFVFDGKAKHRFDAFPEYKAGRKAKPIELMQQMAAVRELIVSSGFEYAYVEDDEADDVIATLARQLSVDTEVLMCSADKDYAQTVGGTVVQLKPSSHGAWDRLDATAVKAKFGVVPSMIANFLAITGDETDNIPGIDELGPVFCAKALADEPGFDVLAARIAARKKWPIEQARAALKLNLVPTTARQVDGIKLQRGGSIEQLVGKLRALRCTTAANRFEALNRKPASKPEATQLSFF